MDTRAQLVALLNNKVLSGGRRTTAQYLRDYENAVIQSVINIIDDKDQNDGYLGIDSNGRVDISKITAVTPVGDFLRDDGTWSSVLTTTPDLNAVLVAGPNTNGEDIIIDDADYLYVGSSNNGYFHYNSISSRIELKNVSSDDQIYMGDAGGITAMLSSGQFMRLETDQFLARGNVAGSAFLLSSASSNQMYHPAANYFNSPLHNFIGDVTLASETANTLPWINGTNAVKSSTIVADGNELKFLSGYGIDTTATGGTDSLNIAANNADIVNIGRPGIQVNIFGARNWIQTTDTEFKDSLITLNKGGTAGSGFYVGYEIEENSLITGYWKTTVGRDGWIAKVPAVAYTSTFDYTALGSDRSYTFPNASGTFILSSTLSSSGFVQGGNAFGATAVLGTTDNYDLNFITSNATVARFTASGNFETYGGNGNNSNVAIHQSAANVAGTGRIIDVYNNSYSKQMLAIIDNGVTGQVYLAAGALTINAYTGQSIFNATNVSVRGSVTGGDHFGVTSPTGTGGIYFSDTTGNPRIYFQNSSAATVGELLSSGVSYLSGGAFDMRATGGNGYYGLVAQSSNVSAPSAAGFRLFAGSTGSFNWVRNNGVSDTYVRTFDATLTASRTYTLQDASSTIAMYSNKLSVFSATTSAELAGVISDETGSGLLVFGTTPTLSTPILASATSNTAGALGYDGTVFYSTTNTNNQGLSPSVYFIRQDTTYTLTSTTNVQQLFNGSTNGRVTLPVGTYRFNALFKLTLMDGTSGNAAFSLAGGATMGTFLYSNWGYDTAPTTGPGNFNGGFAVGAATGASMQTPGVATQMAANLTGTFEVTVSGTVIPSIALLNAAAAVVAAGSYFECWSIGGTSAAYLGAWD